MLIYKMISKTLSFKALFELVIVTVFVLLQLTSICCSEKTKHSENSRNVSVEAKIIAMEYADTLLPPENLSIQISEDLIQIRKSFASVANLTYHGKWHPGELITEVTLTPEEKQKINESEYGPLIYIGQSESYNLSLLIFSSLYNPETLSILMKNHFDIECKPFYKKTPVVITYDGCDEDSKSNPQKDLTEGCTSRKYTFERRYGGACHQEPSLCKKRHFWVFMITENGPPVLENEYDAPKNNYVFTQ